MMVRESHLRRHLIELDEFFRSPQAIQLVTRSAFAGLQDAPIAETKASDLAALSEFATILMNIQAQSHELFATDIHVPEMQR